MATHLPTLSSDAGLTHYIQEIKRFPMLSAEDEFMLAKRYQKHQDKESAHQLVTSHLRLVVKMAMTYRGYGLPVADIIAEGNIGLMQAVKKFDPDKGFRLSTYAMWWIKASIQEFILKSWSLVKIGTTSSHKKLFFNLRKIKNKILKADQKHMDDADVLEISKTLNVSKEDVIAMDQRMTASDYSLNAPVSTSEDDDTQWQDRLADTRPTQDTIMAEDEELGKKKNALHSALIQLNDREQAIIKARHLSEEPETLETLSQRFHISRERIRQIETNALKKLGSKTLEAFA